jgi:hypothetical protein
MAFMPNLVGFFFEFNAKYRVMDAMAGVPLSVSEINEGEVLEENEGAWGWSRPGIGCHQ